MQEEYNHLLKVSLDVFFSPTIENVWMVVLGIYCGVYCCLLSHSWKSTVDLVHCCVWLEKSIMANKKDIEDPINSKKPP